MVSRVQRWYPESLQASRQAQGSRCASTRMRTRERTLAFSRSSMARAWIRWLSLPKCSAKLINDPGRVTRRPVASRDEAT